MKKLLFAIITIGLISCSSDEPENCCTIISLGTDIKYENEEGLNLVDNSDTYNVSDIEVFHKIDGEWKRYFEGNLDYPKGLRKTEINGESYLTVFLSSDINEDNISETKLVFENGEEDIIKSVVNKNSGNEIVTKIWYNEDLKWSNQENVEPRFTIIK
tara:strand:- start:1269 stop:1742 length:474 start_codon:yes stop_codon:yes gene_type:complete